MSGLQWREERGGKFVKETPRFRLQVHSTVNREYVRVIVLRRSARSATLVGSGTTGGIGHAMRAAEKMAERFTSSDRHDRPLVIVVDDDTAVSGAVADILRDEGYDVVQATSGEGALRRLERIDHPTILVSDLCLGSGMTGLELAATVSDVSPATGILLMSAGDLDGNDVLPHALLRKPFSAKQLVHAVAAATRRSGPQ